MTDGETTKPRQLGFRFGIGSLMLVTFVFGVVGAAARQFVLVVQHGTTPRALFVIFTLAAPMIALVMLSIVHQVVYWASSRARQTTNESDVRIDS